MDKLRLGIVGIGNMGSAMAINVAVDKKCPSYELVAICDISEERREWAKKTYNEALIFDNAEDMYKSGKIDVVYIATPHYDHPKLAMLAFKYKLHVMTEKPAGVFTKDVREMNEAADKSGVKFSIMFQCRSFPLMKKLKELLDSGYYGQIRNITWLVTSWYRSQFYYNTGSWRATWAGEGGGVLLNQCPHNLDLLQWLCGMPEEITAKCEVGNWHDIEVEDDVVAILKYKNGALGSFITSTGISPGTNRLEIATDRGTLIMENDELTIYELCEKEQDFSKKITTAFEEPQSSKVTYKMYEDLKAGHPMMMEVLASAIRGEGELIADGREGINELTLSNAMYLSSWLNKTIKLPIDEDLYYEELQKRVAISKHKDVKPVYEDVSGTYMLNK